jgi:hypothetical protein
MILLLPLAVEDQQTYYSYQVELGEVVYGLRVWWRERQSSWYMSLDDEDGNVLVGSHRLTPNVPLLQQYTGRVPTGGFLMAAVSGSDTNIDFDVLGVDAWLVWYDDDEMTTEVVDLGLTIS